jgi:hypothetical protein
MAAGSSMAGESQEAKQTEPACVINDDGEWRGCSRSENAADFYFWCLLQAFANIGQEFFLVGLHELHQLWIVGLFMFRSPEDQFGENGSKVNAFGSEQINELSSVRWIRSSGDDSMSDQLAKPVSQNVCCDSLVGLEELLVAAEPAQHHVADNQQRPAVAEHFDGSVQRTPRAPFRTGLVLEHAATVAYFTCNSQVISGRLAFAARPVLVRGISEWHDSWKHHSRNDSYQVRSSCF